MPVVSPTRGPSAQLSGLPGAQLAAPQINTPDARLNAPTISTGQFNAPQVSIGRLKPLVVDPNSLSFVPKSDAGARQLIGAGNALGAVSSDIAQATLRYQAKVNATVVDDALNDARETARKLTFGTKDEAGNLVGGYRNLKGYDAVKRPGDKSLDAEVGDDFDKTVRTIAKNKIVNPDQRRAFEAQLNDMKSQLLQGASTHQAQEFDRYHTSVYQGMVSNLTADFGMLDPGDLNSQKVGIDKIEQAVATLAAHNGASSQELDVGMRAARSAAVSTLFDNTVAIKKYDTAQALLNTWGDKIDPAVSTKMKSALDGHVGIMLGEQLGSDAWRHWGEPSFDASDPTRAFNIMLGQESGTKHTSADGKLIVSPKGAGGIAQVMPDTAKEVAKSLGRPELAELAFKPTQEGQAANLVLGRAYFDKLLGKYKGDTAKAMAAYNAGPGRLDEALTKARTEGGDWRGYLPQETQDYVRNGTAALTAGQGKPAKPSRQALYDQIDARSDDPDVRKAAYAWIDKRFTAADYDEREGQETAYAQALDVVRGAGGDINAVTPELRRQMKPENFTTLQAYAKNLADGAFTVTKPEAYYTAMDPAALKAMTINQLEALRPDMSEQDFKAAQNAWKDVHAPEPSKGPESLDITLLDSLVNTRLQYLGISATAKKGDTAEAARLGAIKQFAHQYVLDRQRQTGIKISEYKGMQDAVNELFTKSEKFKTTWLGVRTGGGKMNVMTAEVKDLPVETRSGIKAELKKHLGREPSDAEILQSYFRSQFYK